MRINHNLMAMNTQRQLGVNNEATGKSLEKLSSGLRINRAGDDAAGLAISEKMRGQIRGLNQASRNSQDGISLIQTAEGALNETHDILQRMRELAVQSANDTNVGVDRGEVQKELNQLTSEINRIGNTTEYNTMKLLNGDRSETFDTGKTIVGALAQTATVLGAGIAAATNALVLKDNSVKITTTGDATWNAAATGNVTIQKNASGQLQVDITLGEGSGATANKTMNDKIDVTFDANGSYTYDKHGVSFTISQADFDAAGAGSGSITMDLDVNKGVGGATSTDFTGTYSVKAAGSWTANTGNATMAGVTVDASKVDKNIAKVVVNFSSGATSYSISLQDASGNTLVTDKATGLSAASTGLTYSNHGISFTVGAIDANMTGTFSVDLKTGTKSVTEDRSLSFQVGANENQAMNLGITDLRSVALGISSKTAGGSFNTGAAVTDGTNSKAVEFSLDVSTHDAAAKSVTVLQNAIEKVSAERSKIGAVQNRLEHTIKNLDTSSENLQAAESRVRDVDMAKEMMNYQKNNILQQAAQAMLAQANQSTQGVLQLLR